MSVNLGPEAFAAITRLKNNSDWRAFVVALHEHMHQMMHRALDAPVDDRVDATGYCRALRDVVAHIELVEQPRDQPNRNPKPAMRARLEEAHV